MKPYVVLFFAVTLSTATGCASRCLGINCYPAHRETSIRAAHNIGSYSGALLGGTDSRRAARHLRPARTIEPVYNYWLDQFVNSIIGP